MQTAHILLYFCVPIPVISTFQHTSPVERNLNIVRQFSSFIQTFNRTYGRNTPEYYRRFLAFKESLDRHRQLNKDRTHNSLARYGINQFSDLTPKEFALKYLAKFHGATIRKSSGKLGFVEPFGTPDAALPKKMDWRTKGVITPVKDQKSCGACWAFSCVETIESMNAIKHGSLVALSVQQLINCAEGNYKCNGGFPCLTADWLMANNINITTEAKYPTTDTSGDCTIQPKKGVNVNDCICNTQTKNETQYLLLPLANHGPISVAVNAALWQDYLGGIIRFHCSAQGLNHAVQIVGYDLTGDIPYYIVRNSWGNEFGHNGYLYIEVGKNVCGVGEEVLSLDVV